MICPVRSVRIQVRELPLAIVLALALALAWDGTARGAEGPAAGRRGGAVVDIVEIVEVPLPEVVFGGDEVAFDLDLPDGSDEQEFYLSLDGGESWPVRLRAERSSRGLLVVLPSLSAPRARLKLRSGGEEEGEEFETDVAISSRFELLPEVPRGEVRTVRPVADQGLAGRRGDFVSIEWSVSDRPGVVSASPLVPASLEPVPSVQAGAAGEGLPLVPSPRCQLLRPREAATACDGPLVAGSARSLERDGTSARLPAPVPMRN